MRLGDSADADFSIAPANVRIDSFAAEPVASRTQGGDLTMTKVGTSHVASSASSAAMKVLEATPGRALTLLRAIGTSEAIRRFLEQAGYSDADHREGWDLLHRCSGYQPRRPPRLEDPIIREAIRTLDAWDEDGFRVVRASLTRHFPDQAAFVLADIGPADGAAAVAAVKALLARLDVLELGRKGAEAADHAAISLLERRGIGPAKRAELRALVADAERAAPPLSRPDAGDAEGAYMASLVRLREWYLEWSAISKAVVRRRDYLIRMGLAARRVLRTKVEGDGDGQVAS